jgi:diguanylate cyclase (GGDEF)-like protein
MSIRLKLILVLSVVLVIAFAATSLITFVVSREGYRATAVDEILPLLTSNILSEIQLDLLVPKEIATLMATDTFLKSWVLNGEKELDQIQTYLGSIRDKYGVFTTFFVSERTGRYYYYDGLLKTISRDDSHDVWYYTFAESDAEIRLDVDTDEASAGTLTVFINHRVVDDTGQLIGVAGVGLSMSGISQLLAEFQLRFGRLVYLVDSDGLVQAHPDISLIESMSIMDVEGIRDVAVQIRAQTSDTAAYEFDRNGHRVFLEARYLPEFEWYLIGEQDEADSLGRIQPVLLSNLIIGMLATFVVILIVVVVVNRFQGKLEALVSVDSLTEVANRRHFMNTLRTEFARSQRYQNALCMLMIDVDRFKSVNDRHGHLVGDQLLKSLAETIQVSLRDSDTLGRLGGEEFGVILPETALAEALIVAERIRGNVSHRSAEFDPHTSVLQMTVSIGASVMHAEMDGYEDLYKQADAALYLAKDTGRDRVCTNQEAPSDTANSAE